MHGLLQRWEQQLKNAIVSAADSGRFATCFPRATKGR
jgi:hypothetical protein